MYFNHSNNKMTMKNKFPYRNEQYCIWRIVDNETIIFSEEGGWLHKLNNMGAEIWNMCDGRLDIKEITDNICNEFDVEKDIVEADVYSFIEELSQKELVILKDKVTI
jgi:GeoRSP system PqqD family protein